MKTLCDVCFSNSVKINDSLLACGKLFWVGYLLCDPKEFSIRKNKYDLHINEVNQMNFENLPVIFNHNKKRKPLGKVILTWHDHYLNKFSVGFLAVLNNKTFLNSPSSIILMMSENSVSLSTLESDRTKPIELSITYCGARTGCLAVFVPKQHAMKWCEKFGLYRNSSLYKCKYPNNINAAYNYQNMTEDNNSTLAENLASTLMSLPKDQYNTISENLKENQVTIEKLMDEISHYKNKLNESKSENSKHSETINLLSDFLTSMVKSRLELEKDSNSQLAIKKRKDFEELQNKNIFDNEGIPNLNHIKDLIMYCNECLCTDEPHEIETVKKVIDSFKSYFPDLQLPKQKTTISTIDAAFGILNENVERLKRAKELVDRSKTNQGKALEIAKRNYETLSKFSSDQNHVGINKKGNNRKRNMDFEEFMKDHFNKDDISPPSPKRRKTEKYEESSSTKYSEDFYNYVRKKEEMRKRLDGYRDEYTKHMEMKNAEKKKQIDELISLVPHIKDIIENKAQQQNIEKPTQIQEKTVDASSLNKKETLYEL